LRLTNEFSGSRALEKLRRDLWVGREFGQAAVMIGAGFSRNAEKTQPSAPDFPLWTTVAEMMYQDLYPPATDPPSSDYETAKLRATSGTGAVRLASEYEAAFGMIRLDALLLRAIRDDAYIPGEIHRLLLTLPWSDVFTTNYDTLLERARSSIVDRRYDLLLTSADIPGRMKPRIIKLHGSFPSHRPFIMTEEDFRTYPQRFAPFVNTVQQSIMENSFCLLGFSGDDPNFLYWSGWVRDNLGVSASNIYLCGLLNLTDSQKALLRRRNVTPIDLSPLFPASMANRHANAIRWFLLSLLNGSPPDARNWPDGDTSSVVQPTDIPNLVPPPVPNRYDAGPIHPTITHQ
jgi:hypothetical protein